MCSKDLSAFMAIQSVTGSAYEPEIQKSDDEIAFDEAMEKGGLTDDESIYFAAQGFKLPG